MVVQSHTWKLIGGGAALAVGGAALWSIHPWLLGAGLIATTSVAGCVGWQTVRRYRDCVKSEGLATLLQSKLSAAAAEPEPVEETGDLIDQMLRQGRYALLLRPQIVANLAGDQVQRAMDALDEHMALVPDGDVVLRASRYDATDEENDINSIERLVRVQALFLDRYPVTNRQYRAFITAGGYEQISLWEASVWPAILDFVDTTGHPGPRFWKEGNYPAGQEDHPVVGVSWYEANAYARWVGKRLPTDPEWVKAGSWPVQCEGGKPLQRRHPWGDTMDRTHANLWGSGPGTTVSIHELNNGGTVGGVYQLIGNCWEWTSSNFGAWDPALRRLETPSQMKSVRGGAFDTYFDCQANNQFQSGDSPMSRKHNIGFRCALGVCDLGNLNRMDLSPETDEADLETDDAQLCVAEVGV